MVVQERRLWLNLAEMKDVEKARFPRRPGDTVEGFAQQFLEFALSQETARTETLLPPGGGPGGESFVSFCSAAGPRAGDDIPPHAPLASPRLGPREFGEDASERTAFCIAHPYSLSLHHRYVDCAVGAACTASGGVAHAAQPVSLAHAHDSTRLRDSVHQATAQVQRRSRDIGGGPERPCLARGDCCPPGKGCNRADPSSRDEAGVSQPLLHRTQPILVVNNQSWIGES